MTDLPFDPRRLPDPRHHVPLDDAVEGWRAWIVERELPPFGNPPKLRSINGGSVGVSAAHGVWLDKNAYYWTPRRTAVAECRLHACDPIEIPRETCSCGFYSAKTSEHLLDQLNYAYFDADVDKDVRVIGTVANWGKVIEGTQGWRASKSYPTELWVPYSAAHLAEPLKKAYGVKVGLRNFVQPPFEEKN